MSTEGSSSATLGNTPLLHLLVSMADRQMSGSLAVETPDHSSGTVVFESGVPRKISVSAPHCRLSDLLVEFGWLDAYAAETTYATAKEQRELHGRVLMEHRLVDEAGLSNLLYHQLVRKLGWVAMQSSETSLGLHEGVDLLAATPLNPLPVSPLALLWAVAKSHVDERNKRAVLSRAANRALQLHPNSDPSLFGFNDLEMTLVDRLRHMRMDLTSLLYQLDLPRQTAESLLYVLLLTRHIDVGDARQPIGIAVAPVPARGASGEYSASRSAALETVPESPKPEPDAELRLRHDLRQHAERAKSADYYTLLGVAPDAPIGAIRDAFTGLARRYHPERLPVELNDLRPVAAQLLTRWMAAYRALADEQQRARYDRSRSEAASESSENAGRDRLAHRALCADAIRRAEQLLKRDRLLLAEAEAKRALELEPQNPRCIALHAWIMSLLPNSAETLEQLLASLTTALDLDPMDVQSRFFRSELLKRLDRIEEAVGEWQLILELDPVHIDAQRELRLWEMRRASSHPPNHKASGTHRQVSARPPAPGLFGRLFKGSK